ncbi:uncharacterized protein ASCRUDRAFT_72541 [Ascoidea rubescens DSM 1968]|uniref:Solute carrier family 40 member n=1 Tax=Ascoidea rubescens DSM 1968 TaxID=1344418 RepID=A0A1D2VAD4_9ASCO|nr:hypothetical protein ASCRUDRAFT_72541 [Ascoidea rubescens DSM 1968]ODV58614.1 hypothetical protein ASCRUDRAFT_72541 [Ascoidea rubescens DSM 1968]
MTSTSPKKKNDAENLETQPLLTSTSNIHGTIDQNDTDRLSVIHEIKKKLYISHFLYVWNARVYEFGIILFIVDLFPQTLLPSSLFALCCSLTSIIFSTSIATIVNNGERLHVVRETIFIQRSSVILSTFSILLTHIIPKLARYKVIVLIVVIICGGIEKLCALANKISIQRDWLVHIAEEGNEGFLVELNTQMRSIDLFSKLLGPTFIALVIGFTSIKISLVFIIVSFLVSNPIEYYAIARVYYLVPELQKPKRKQVIVYDNQENYESLDQSENSNQSPILKKKSKSQFITNLKVFSSSTMCLPTISYALLYLTVLSFGNSTIAYLLSFPSINDELVGILRAISSIFELSSTVIFPPVNKNFGLINTGLISLVSQFTSLIPILTSFLLSYKYSYKILCICIPFSRLGLWGYDLSIQNMIQIYVNDDERAGFTAIEESIISLCELSGYAVTMVFHKPSQFHWPAYISVGSIGLAALLYITFFLKYKAGKIQL